MLEKLKRELTLIALGLSGAVLLIALAMTFCANWSTQTSVTSSLLQRSLAEGVARNPQMGSKDREGTIGADSMLAITIDVTQGGYMLSKSESPVEIDSEALSEIIESAAQSTSDEGYSWSHHLAWATKRTTYGWRIAVCDTYSRDTLLLRTGLNSLFILVIAMAALYLISRVLANWIVKPVAEAWDAQRRFISDASHELKTPLAVIIANIQILQKDQTIGEEGMKWVGRTADEAAHMKSLVEDLLTLARADEAKAGSVGAAGPMVELDLSEIVNEAALEFDAVAFERGCEIECTVAPGVRVKGDKAQLGRVVNTLLDNATKYAPKGTRVKVSLAQDAKRASLSVNNLGSPIEPDELEHLFDRFYRTDKARERQSQGGFGLGLAIAKSIVEAHGGIIWAESTEGAGTTFRVQL